MSLLRFTTSVRGHSTWVPFELDATMRAGFFPGDLAWAIEAGGALTSEVLQTGPMTAASVIRR